MNQIIPSFFQAFVSGLFENRPELTGIKDEWIKGITLRADDKSGILDHITVEAEIPVGQRTAFCPKQCTIEHIYSEGRCISTRLFIRFKLSNK